MPFPWGGSLTHSDLARKFGWPSVCLSLMLLPFTVAIRNILAFPPWLQCITRSSKASFRYSYPDEPDFVQARFYEASTAPKELGCLPGFLVLADVAGGKWFESFWGLIHVAELQQEHSLADLQTDLYTTTWRVSMTWRSYLGPGSTATIVFAEDRKSHVVAFDIGMQLQPFCFVGMAWMLTALARFGSVNGPWLAQVGGDCVHVSSKAE